MKGLVWGKLAYMLNIKLFNLIKLIVKISFLKERYIFFGWKETMIVITDLKRLIAWKMKHKDQMM